MSAKFTSEVKGRVVIGIECGAEEAERLQADESKTFYVAPSTGPRGFIDFSAGMTAFPVIGTDGNITDTTLIYEVLDEDDPRAILIAKAIADERIASVERNYRAVTEFVQEFAPLPDRLRNPERQAALDAWPQITQRQLEASWPPVQGTPDGVQLPAELQIDTVVSVCDGGLVVHNANGFQDGQIVRVRRNGVSRDIRIKKVDPEVNTIWPEEGTIGLAAGDALEISPARILTTCVWAPEPPSSANSSPALHDPATCWWCLNKGKMG